MGKIALVFSGQGAQYTGMGKDLYDNSPEARAVFNMADSIRPGTSKQCFEADTATLSETLNTQPCVFTVNLAAARAVLATGIKPDCLAGFSLGEIDALAVSGILSDEEAFKLVCKRAEYMDAAAKKKKGAMAAILRLSAAQVEQLCRETNNRVWPVNYNSPGQLVVAGLAEHMDDFYAAVKANKGRVVPLSVSGAFHSPLMREASRELYEYMKDVEFKDPTIPVYSNYSAEIYESHYREFVREQICNPVRWQTIVENIVEEDVDYFIEVGVGKTLTGLIGRIDSFATAVKVENTADLEKLKEIF